MKVVVQGGSLMVIAESREDNRAMQAAGIDADRLLVGVRVARGEVVQHSGEIPFEPLIVILSPFDEILEIEEGY